MKRQKFGRTRLSDERKLEHLEPRQLLAVDLAVKSDFHGADGLPEPEAIVGGVTSPRGAYGWVASLQQSGFGHLCGGTLVSPDAVITAAHCVEGSSAESFSVVLGREDLDRNDDGQEVAVSQIIVHPDYNPLRNGSDIAVLLLESDVDELPIPYLSQANASLAEPGVTARVLGWGTTREGGPAVSELREVDVPIVSNATANAFTSYGGSVTGNMLAAGFREGGADSCQGDSGGPLVVFDDQDSPHLAGVVSWGEGCARPNKYGIYARVTAFTGWLDEIVGFDDLGTVDFTQERYFAGDEIQIALQDANATASEIDVVVETDGGDRETVSLTSFAAGRYRATLPASQSSPSPEDGTLNVANEESIRVTYIDMDNGDGNQIELSSEALIVVDDFGDTAADAEPLELDEPIVAEIDVVGDVDWFQFDGEVGKGYEITVDLENESLNYSLLSIYGSDGEMLLGFDDEGGRGLGSEMVYFPRVAETVFVEAAGFGANVGSYRLTVVETDDPGDDHPDIIGGATELTVGRQDTGTIDVPGDQDWFQFDAEEGVVYELRARLGSIEDTQLRLVDSDGRTELAFNDDIELGIDRQSRIFYRAEETETLYVEVTGWSDETGSYRVIVDTQDDDHGNTSESATEIGEVGTTSSEEFGEITALDVDWFSVSVEADSYYEFRTFSTDTQGFDDTILSVYDETGERLLAQNDDQRYDGQVAGDFLSRIVWQAPTTGVYHVEVAAWRETTANYRLNARELDPRPLDITPNRAEIATEIEVPGPNNSAIDYQADEDWYRFEALAGGDYSFRVTLRGLPDSVLRLFEEDGETLISENDDVDFPNSRGSAIEWTAPTSGVRYLQVSGFDGATGNYRLRTSVELQPIPGDVNNDRRVDVADIDFLHLSIRTGLTDESFDLNSDGEINSQDVDALLEIMNATRGDATLDGVVDLSDFLALSRSFGTSGGGWAGGDFDGDLDVDISDYLQLSRNFGRRTDELVVDAAVEEEVVAAAILISEREDRDA